jgi:hypothetical protein
LCSFRDVKLLAPGKRPGANEGFMKKITKSLENDMRPEYDFASMKGGVRGKYVCRFRAGTNLVLLEPDVAKAFPTNAAVNEALRGLLETTNAVRRTGGLPNKALRPTTRPRRTNCRPGEHPRAARG